MNTPRKPTDREQRVFDQAQKLNAAHQFELSMYAVAKKLGLRSQTSAGATLFKVYRWKLRQQSRSTKRT
jgi:hypothetical protein